MRPLPEGRSWSTAPTLTRRVGRGEPILSLWSPLSFIHSSPNCPHDAESTPKYLSPHRESNPGPLALKSSAYIYHHIQSFSIQCWMNAYPFSFHMSRSAAILIHIALEKRLISSTHLAFGRRLGRFFSLGIKCSTFVVHLPSVRLAIWPAHFHLYICFSTFLTILPRKSWNDRPV